MRCFFLFCLVLILSLSSFAEDDEDVQNEVIRVGGSSRATNNYKSAAPASNHGDIPEAGPQKGREAFKNDTKRRSRMVDEPYQIDE